MAAAKALLELLVAEKALRAIVRPDDAPYWLYQAARDYAEHDDSRYANGLTPESAPMVEDIATFLPSSPKRRWTRR